MDEFAGGEFVGRVARREIGADGEARDACAQRRQIALQRRQIERPGVSVDIVTAAAEDDGVAAKRLAQAVAVKVRIAEADHDERDPAALSLDERVRRQRRRHRDQLDRRRRNVGAGERRVDRAGDALGQVVARRQRLRLGHDGS